MRYMKNVHTACPKARSHPYIPTKLGTPLTDCLALRVRASNWTGVLGRAVLLRVSRSLRAFCMLLAPMQDLLTHMEKRAIYIYLIVMLHLGLLCKHAAWMKVGRENSLRTTMEAGSSARGYPDTYDFSQPLMIETPHGSAHWLIALGRVGCSSPSTSLVDCGESYRTPPAWMIAALALPLLAGYWQCLVDHGIHHP